MKTYVIFDRKSGEVLQTHVQSIDGHDDSLEMLRELRPNAKHELLDLLPITERLVPGTRYRVDVKTKKLVQVEGVKGRGFGAASVHQNQDGPREAQRVLVQVKRAMS